MNINSKVKLNNGVEIPYLGLGTWLLNSGKETQNAVLWALEFGYRLIDTASIYGNESDVGIAIKKSKISRDKIFVTTKLWNSDQGYEKTLKAFEKSLKILNLSYIDLYLVHWPAEKKSLREETWKAIEKVYMEGKCRAIGVSNYTIKHLSELLEIAEIIPAINQVEFSPFLYQKELLEFCNSNKIQVEAYSPLTRGKKLNDPKLLEIAEKYGKTPAQILIRWALQHSLVVIPKSSKKEHIYENSQVFDFEISKGDMEKLDSLDENFRVCWNPENIP
ncbi:MAG: aldo/keto reductase [Candidatus Altiarchaeota archaeon]